MRPGWTYRTPAGRATSALTGVAALAAARAVAGPRSRTLRVCAVVPDVALLIGIAAAPTWKQLPPYAIRPYNTLHSPAVPAALLLTAAVARHRGTTVAGLAWLAHIAIDRAFGYGPRDAEGFVAHT
jgi:D-alanyl-D-alanine dipeptidase